jgi:ATP-dependent Clp protease ATP-binding subunit ClpA
MPRGWTARKLKAAPLKDDRATVMDGAGGGVERRYRTTRSRRVVRPKVAEPELPAERLEPGRLGDDVESFREGLAARVIGQQPAIDAVTEAYQIFRAGLASPDRPLGSFLFLGPTGTGKTNLVEAMAEVCFDDRRAMLKIDCAEFSHSHEIARLIGSPPGYLGHQETNPYLSSGNLLRYQTADFPFTLLLFDEIEKANDALWQLLLGVLDKARLTLGTNKEVDLSSCFIFLTSNIGSRSVSEILAPRLGFATTGREPEGRVQSRIEDAVLWAARRTFSPEFMNRLDHKIVFHRLSGAQLERILDLELAKIEQRLARRGEPIRSTYSTRARQRLLAEGTDPEHGARPLKRVLERRIVFPLARLIASRQLLGGETVAIDWRDSASEPEFVLAGSRHLVARAG